MKPKLQLQTLPIHCQLEYFLDVVWLLGVLQDEGNESEILPRTVFDEGNACIYLGY